MSLVGVCELILKMLGLPMIKVIDDDFCYYDVENNVIGVNYADMLKASDCFYDFVGETFYQDAKMFSIVLWSFLHEVGHYNEQFETEETIKDLADSDNVVRSMLKVFSSEEETSQRAYFNLPREKYATGWAATFIKENLHKCIEVNKMCQEWEKGV